MNTKKKKQLPYFINQLILGAVILIIISIVYFIKSNM